MQMTRNMEELSQFSYENWKVSRPTKFIESERRLLWQMYFWLLKSIGIYRFLILVAIGRNDIDGGTTYHGAV